MNKLYYLLIVLPLMLLTSCGEDGPEVVKIGYQESSLTTTGINPAQGYVGEQIAITGTEFGNSSEFMKVYIGDFQGEMVACSDERIIVKVPEEAVSGRIILELLGKKIATDLNFTVLDVPILSMASALTGYAGDEITIIGTGMPATGNNLSVMFGDTKAEITSYVVDKEGNATLKANMSKRQLAGTIDLVVKMFDREIFNKKFKVLAAPIVNVYDNRFVKAGGELIITGSGFRDFVGNVKIDFNGMVVEPGKVTDTAIIVQLPDGYMGGEVSVTLGDFPSVEIGELQVLNIGDITEKVLKNSAQPFKPIDGYVAGTEWTTAADWILANYSGENLQFTESVSDGLLAFRASNLDAKVYQIVTLPKGKYRFTLDIAECSTTGGRFGVIFTVTKGKATIPNIEDKKPWYFVNDSDVLAYYRITDTQGANQQREVMLTLTEDMEMTIGFVIQLLNQGTVKLSSIKVTMEQ